jgi:hypothetical protein
LRETAVRHQAGEEQPIDWIAAKRELADGDECIVYRVLDCRQKPETTTEALK